MVQYLTKEQQERCYDVFLFDETEFITNAWYENNQLYIEYVCTLTEDEGPTVYEPCLEGAEGFNKLNYILTGEKIRWVE